MINNCHFINKMKNRQYPIYNLLIIVKLTIYVTNFRMILIYSEFIHLFTHRLWLM